MKITELELIMKNKHVLDDDDKRTLESFNLEEQYKNGELDLPALKMLELLGLLAYMCEKHNLK